MPGKSCFLNPTLQFFSIAQYTLSFDCAMQELSFQLHLAEVVFSIMPCKSCLFMRTTLQELSFQLHLAEVLFNCALQELSFHPYHAGVVFSITPCQSCLFNMSCKLSFHAYDLAGVVFSTTPCRSCLTLEYVQQERRCGVPRTRTANSGERAPVFCQGQHFSTSS